MNTEELKSVHLTLLKADLEAFRQQCKENFTTVSAELKRLIKQQIRKKGE